MSEFWEKIKKFFKDKINLTIVCLLLLFIIAISLGITAVWYNKLSMVILAVALCLVAYKCYKKHAYMKDIYNNIDSIRQEKKENTFTRIANNVNKIDRYNFLIYAIVFAGIALMILIYVLFK